MASNPRKEWVPFFSQTGGEILNIMKSSMLKPRLVVTNRPEADVRGLPLHEHLQRRDIPLLCSFSNESHQYRILFCPDTDILTLHGYLRIVPAEACDTFEIYNGHPGDVIKYPELKGKDPQKKALKLKLESTGCVLHKVTKDLDGGPIIARREMYIKPYITEDLLIEKLKDLMLPLWISLLEEKLS